MGTEAGSRGSLVPAAAARGSSKARWVAPSRLPPRPSFPPKAGAGNLQGISPKEPVSGIVIETHFVPQLRHYLQKYIFICRTVSLDSFNFSWEGPAGGSGLQRKWRIPAVNFSELVKLVFPAAKIREEVAVPDSCPVQPGNRCGEQGVGGLPRPGQLSLGHPTPGTGERKDAM